MENKEFQFKGMTMNGFAMLFVNIMLTVLSAAIIVTGFIQNLNDTLTGLIVGFGFAVFAVTLFIWAGFVMLAFENFVKTQSDAALRQVAGLYAYDNNESGKAELTLRDSADEINKQLEEKLDERLSMAGIEVVEARINYLAYAPEIAAVMLRRQQADAIISAREKIVEGAVSMVKMALDKLSSEEIVDLDDDKKAAMVSNLLVVLCGDDSAQPVVNAGTLNH